MENELTRVDALTGLVGAARPDGHVDLLRSVLDDFPALFALTDSSGRIEFVNRRAVEYFNRSFEVLKDWVNAGVIHPDDLMDVVEAWARSFDGGKPFDMECRLRRGDGVYRWFHARTSPTRDVEGRIVFWHVVASDIDDRKRAETQLAGENQLLEMVATGRPLRDVLASLCGVFEKAAVGCLCGVYPIDWSGPTFQNAVAPTLPASYLAPVEGLPVRPEAAPCGVAALERVQVIVADIESDPRWHGSPYCDHVLTHGLRSVWSTPISSLEGGVLGTFCIYRRSPASPSPHVQDLIAQVTHIASIAIERARTEAALRKSEAYLAKAQTLSLGALTASIAHEVTQPLSGILTNASTCLRMLASEPPNVTGARETARRTIRDGNRASEVITRLRGLFTRKAPALELVDVNEATREVIALSCSELQRSRVTVRAELSEDLPVIMGDRIQLQQVILNLLRNASDAMSAVDDRPREIVIITSRDDDTDRVRLSVKDSGPGFGSQNMDKVFDAFYTTKHDGMGIGLSVSRSIVESHRGRLWATPNDGPGVTFSFAIPRGLDFGVGAHKPGTVSTPAVTHDPHATRTA